MAATPNISDYLVGNGPALVYRFPNGHTASVHHSAAGFAVWSEALLGDNTVGGLSVSAMAATLRDILALPAD